MKKLLVLIVILFCKTSFSANINYKFCGASEFTIGSKITLSINSSNSTASIMYFVDKNKIVKSSNITETKSLSVSDIESISRDIKILNPKEVTTATLYKLDQYLDSMTDQIYLFQLQNKKSLWIVNRDVVYLTCK